MLKRSDIAKDIEIDRIILIFFCYRLNRSSRKILFETLLEMKKLLSQFTVTFSLGIACAFGLAAPSLAQSQTEGNYQSNEKDSMYGDSTLGVNPMDLIHNYNLSVGRSAAEFNQESQVQIQDSAAEFRRLQQEKMLQQYNTVPQTEENVAE